jgi:hypothetical protein
MRVPLLVFSLFSLYPPAPQLATGTFAARCLCKKLRGTAFPLTPDNKKVHTQADAP